MNRMKSIFVSMFALVALASCNNDESAYTPPTGGGTAELDGGYVTIDIPQPVKTRATAGPGTDNGTTGETTVSNVWVATFDANHLFKNYYELQLLPETGATYLAKTAAIQLNKGAKFMFVVLNAPSQITKKLKTADTSTSFDELKGVVADLTIGDVTVENMFTMTSAGDLSQTDGSNGLTVIGKAYMDAATAEIDANRKSIFVDRLSAKIQVTDMTPKSVTGGTFTAEGWALNVANKQTTLYSELVSFGGASSAKYRMDHNWEFGAQFDTVPTGDSLVVYNKLINDNFTVLYNTNIKDIAFSPVQTATNWTYLFENTMAAKQQLVDRTTNIIFKAKFKPTTVYKDADGKEGVIPATNESYFKYAGRLYNHTGAQAVYTLAETSLTNANKAITATEAAITAAKAAITAAEVILKDSLSTAAQKAQATTDKEKAITKIVTATTDKEEATVNKKKAETVIKDFNDFTVKALGDGKNWKNDATIAALDAVEHAGNVAEMCKLRFYWKGDNYYRGVIKHDYRLGTLALGKFGVVRNNAYSLSIESIAGPGEPWIPGATVPEGVLPGGGGDITFDEDPVNIAVKITVNPWTTWSQGFDM